MIVKSCILKCNFLDKIINQPLDDTILVVCPEPKLDNILHSVIYKTLTNKNSAQNEIHILNSYLDSLSCDSNYRQNKSDFLEKLQDYLCNAISYSVPIHLVEDYILAQCSYLCVQAIASLYDLVVIDSRELVVCHYINSNIAYDWMATKSLIKNKCQNKSKIIISGGFARTADGNVVRIGRSGANLMASLVATALSADALEFYIEGCSEKETVHMTYDEAAHYCATDAAPFFSEALWPAKQSLIPIYINDIANSNHLIAKITSKIDNRDNSNIISGIITTKNLDLITIYGTGLANNIGFSSIIFSSLANAGINIRFISQTISEYALSFAIDINDSKTALKVINELLLNNTLIPLNDVMITNQEVATLTLYGSRMKNIPGTSGKVFSALGNAGINIIASAQGGEELSITLVLNVDDIFKAKRLLHDLGNI